jgi:hypothetical protein
LRWAQKRRNTEKQTMKKDQYWVLAAIKKTSLIGGMAAMISSMRSIHSTHFTHCHLRARAHTNRTSQRSNRKNWESTIRCWRLLIRAIQWLPCHNTSLTGSKVKPPTRRLSSHSSLQVGQRFKRSMLKQSDKRLCPLTLTLSIKRNLWDTIWRLANWIWSLIHDFRL